MESKHHQTSQMTYFHETRMNTGSRWNIQSPTVKSLYRAALGRTKFQHFTKGFFLICWFHYFQYKLILQKFVWDPSNAVQCFLRKITHACLLPISHFHLLNLSPAKDDCWLSGVHKQQQRQLTTQDVGDCAVMPVIQSHLQS